MTEEEKQALIAEGKLDADGNPIAPEKDGLVPGTKPEGTKEEPKFTQAELDAILQDRLKRDREKREAAEKQAREEAERKRLEENQEFKSLADQYKAELDRIKEDALKSKKEALLVKAGYNDEQIERYGKYVEGETEEEMQAAVEQLKADVPPTPKYVDPHANNSQRQAPTPKNKEDKGRTLFQRLKAEGRTGR